MNQTAGQLMHDERARFAVRGQRLEYFTIAYNSLEGLIAIAFGALAGSIALVGFGFDSVIEVTSGAVLLWRLRAEMDERRRERVEALSLRIVGVCFLALAIYVGYEAVVSLSRRALPERSVPGIVLAAASLVVMPLLARAKRRVARGLDSAAMSADAKQTELCTYLSAILLGGLALNALVGWWWADPVAALLMVPLIGVEGYRALRGERCCVQGTCH
ncbi:MAG TPA: cation transporter [Pyrinomonadaceae bacterium]|jgi:divalent metal cation (Fe/Co/Zn/Cd) transporter